MFNLTVAACLRYCTRRHHTRPRILELPAFLLLMIASPVLAALLGVRMLRKFEAVRRRYLLRSAIGLMSFYAGWFAILVATYSIALLTEADLPRWLAGLAWVTLLSHPALAIVILVYADHLRQQTRQGHCQTCGYDLRAHTSAVCPECGTDIGVPSGRH